MPKSSTTTPTQVAAADDSDDLDMNADELFAMLSPEFLEFKCLEFKSGKFEPDETSQLARMFTDVTHGGIAEAQRESALHLAQALIRDVAELTRSAVAAADETLASLDLPWALEAVEQGADFIGMILWPKSKRSIDFALAREIASIAKEGGATPVGVFVDESVDAIVSACKDVGIDHAQLHGDGARLSLKDLPMSIKAIWVVNADKDGVIVTPLPGDEDALMKQRTDAMGANPVTAAVDFVKGPRRVVDWILVDGETAGSGETYDWTNLKPPRGASRKGWLLAGGLDPENVAEAVAVCKPTGVDVASGVTDDSGVKKDASKVEAFIKNAKK